MVNHMYKETMTWNPYKGCLFNCIYCKPSFQRQAKRQKNKCKDCYEYKPHFHPERLRQQLPKNKLIFCCGNGDIAFADRPRLNYIIEEIIHRPDNTFLLQTKSPMTFIDYELPKNVIFGTTIETNRDTSRISKAPPTIDRFQSLKDIKHPRKFITHEPILDFDLDVMLDWDKQIKPEIIWIGYNSHPKEIKLNEPYLKKTEELTKQLLDLKFDVRTKLMREKIL